MTVSSSFQRIFTPNRCRLGLNENYPLIRSEFERGLAKEREQLNLTEHPCFSGPAADIDTIFRSPREYPAVLLISPITFSKDRTFPLRDQHVDNFDNQRSCCV